MDTCNTCKNWSVKYAPSFGICELNKRSTCYNDTCESYSKEDCFDEALENDELINFFKGFRGKNVQ